MARPSSYSPVILPVVRACATFGATAEEIANYLNIPWGSFKRWIYAEPELREALKRGRDASDERVVESLYRNALSGNMPHNASGLKTAVPVNGVTYRTLTPDRPLSDLRSAAHRRRVD